MGMTIIIPVIYLLSWLFGSILWGTIGGILLLVIALTRIKFKRMRFDTSSILLFIFSLIFSTWMMFKTFHGGSGGELFVGSNNIFDFGHALGIIRSMSWGANIPLMSPFFAGLPFLYNFFFNFWVATLEYFGTPIVWAMNIPSILSFSALLIVIYYLPQVLGKQRPLIGWIAVFLTITNSSLTFWKLLSQKADILHLPTYPFAGPYDGSTISIFVTLNSYVNQRHLAFAIALGLLLFILTAKAATAGKNILRAVAVFGVISGFLLLWNMTVYGITVAVCVSILLLYRKWKPAFLYTVISCAVGLVWMIPYVGYTQTIAPFLHKFAGVWAGKVPQWNIVEYLWQNLGVLPLIAVLGLIVLPKNLRKVYIPFVFLFVLECILAGIGHRGFEQKTFSFLVIGINILAAIGIGWIWKRMKAVAVLAVFVLTISGFVDLVPIKNEFAYPLIGKDTVPLVSWIHTHTPKNAVFVSYSDIIDPVVLAGRKNYFGFFGNIGSYDRSPDVTRIYGGDMNLAKSRGISHILVPKWQKNDFPYTVDLHNLPVRYQDARYAVYAVE